MSSTIRTVLCGVAVSLFSSATQASLINSGFETGDFTGWGVSSNSANYGVSTDGALISGTFLGFGPTYVNVRTGSFAAFATVDTNFPFRFLTLSQTVVLAPGTYDVGFYGGADSPNQSGYGPGPTTIFINSVAIPFTSYNIYPGNATFQLFAGQFTTGGGPVSIAFQMSGSGTGTAGFSFDDFFVTALTPPAVPEPGSLALLTLGAVGLIGPIRRRITS